MQIERSRCQGNGGRGGERAEAEAAATPEGKREMAEVTKIHPNTNDDRSYAKHFIPRKQAREE